MLSFFNSMDFWIHSCHKKIIATVPLSFLMASGYIFKHKLARVLWFFIWKKIWHAHYSYLMSCSCLGIIMNLYLYEDKYIFSIIKKRQLSQSLYLSYYQSTLNSHDTECLPNFQVNFDCTEALFYKSKINSYGVYVIRK